MFKRFKYLALTTLVSVSFVTASLPVKSFALSGSDFQAGHIIDDSVFTNANSMGVQDIQNFLNSKVPTCDSQGTQSYSGTSRAAYSRARGHPLPLVCLKDYYENPDNHANNLTTVDGQAAAIPDGAISAAQIIYNAAHAYNINPQVLLTTLQKEQGLVTDDWPWTSQFTKAMGYGCPDTADCNAAYYGLYNQVTDAAWQFRHYLDNPGAYNYWTGNNFINYSPSSCSGTVVNIQNPATAALYIYTPYQPNSAALASLTGTGDSCSSYGNRNFFYYFNTWFGSSLDGTCAADGNTAISTDVTFQKFTKNQDLGTFVIDSGSGTRCVETHTWNSSLTSWNSHIATNAPNIDTTTSKVMYADLNGDGDDEAILVGFKGTGSGRIELHIWNEHLNQWANHIITNAPCINSAISSIAFADVNGDGKDEGILIGQGNGSTSTGNIEFHVWDSSFQNFTQNIISNSHTLDPSLSSIAFADLDGSGKDVPVLIGQGNGSTSTGNIEFHVWNPGFQSWNTHTVSNSRTIDPAVSKIAFADLDGSGRDKAVLIGLRAPTGSGNIEFHVWNPGFQSWNTHITSNQSVQN
jgi:hypothetical protein